MSLNLTSAQIKKLINKPVLVDFRKLNKAKQRQLLEVIGYALQIRVSPYTWFTECYYSVDDIHSNDSDTTTVVNLNDVGDFNTNLEGSCLLVNLVMSNVVKELLSSFVSSIKDGKATNKRGVKLSEASITINFVQSDSDDVVLCSQSSYKLDLSDLNFTPFIKYIEAALKED